MNVLCERVPDAIVICSISLHVDMCDCLNLILCWLLFLGLFSSSDMPPSDDDRAQQSHLMAVPASAPHLMAVPVSAPKPAVVAATAPAKPVSKPAAASSLFGDDDDDMFAKPKPAAPSKPAAVPAPVPAAAAKPAAKAASSLFG
jgi:hypothetical protein